MDHVTYSNGQVEWCFSFDFERDGHICLVCCSKVGNGGLPDADGWWVMLKYKSQLDQWNDKKKYHLVSHNFIPPTGSIEKISVRALERHHHCARDSMFSLHMAKSGGLQSQNPITENDFQRNRGSVSAKVL